MKFKLVLSIKNLLKKGIILHDFHCHLEQSPFYSNIDQYLRKWKENNVKTIIAVTTDKKSLRKMDKLLFLCQKLHKNVDIILAVS